ncbi:hypothetical protein pb186bvf_016781 [Paramecium bursaria]
MGDSSDEDCTIYIEELKSDDANLKINAVSKITSIAQILGEKRTQQELLPYLIEIIEEQDNEDEFLIKLAQEILNLKKYIGGNLKAHLLIAPLEILSSMEEALVREKAVEILSQLAQGQTEQFFENHFCQVVQQLGEWDNFPSRISAASLLPIAYPHVSELKQKELWELFKKLCKDDTPMVRRICAGVVSQLAQLHCLQSKQHKVVLLKIWEDLMKDIIDSVKIKAIEGSQYMLKLVDDAQELVDHITSFFALADLNQKSWRVRYTVPEFLPTILNQIIRINKDKSILKNTATPIYQQLLKDSEPEVRSMTLQTLNQLLAELPNSVKDGFLPFLEALVKDTSLHVRMSLAEQICKIAKQFNQNIQITIIIPLVQTLFKDDVADIKIKLAHNLSQLSAELGQDNSKKHLVPLIKEFQNEKQWRFRLEVMTIMPKLLQVAGYESFVELQENYLEKGLLNHYQAIRDQAFDNFIHFKEIFGYDQIKQFLKTSIQTLYNQSNYIYRVTAIHAIIKLQDTLSKEDLLSLYKEIYPQALQDKVPNVRLNAFKLFTGIKKYLDNKLQQEFKQKSQILEGDEDIDVAYYATNYK